MQANRNSWENRAYRDTEAGEMKNAKAEYKRAGWEWVWGEGGRRDGEDETGSDGENMHRRRAQTMIRDKTTDWQLLRKVPVGSSSSSSSKDNKRKRVWKEEADILENTFMNFIADI